ncbi:MAG: class I SAM-dependent methyltransferase [Rhodothermales bacterium]|nr:class I SAM-dependent methyltransferase [Rhodothermales bacterium]
MTDCIICKSSDVREFLDLGETTLANKFLTEEELERHEPYYPLRIGQCSECGHVQLMEHVPPHEMFEEYLYISSMSETLKSHLHDLASMVTRRMKLTGEDLVIDVGCNDGTLLAAFNEMGARTLGIDPAANLAARANAAGVETFTTYFGKESAEQIVSRWGSAKVVTATNTFPHIPDLDSFLHGLDRVLAKDGCFVLEAHYLQDLLELNAFDTIYHEHVSYWALRPMMRLFSRYDMEVVDVERLPLHHGQIRAWVRRAGHDAVRSSVHQLVAEEEKAKLDCFDTFEAFADRTTHIRDRLNESLDELSREGRRIVGYGAPAKGNTLLTFLGIGPERIEYIADKSPLKQGRFTPGSHIPVVPAERILEDQPDYVLLLAWNFSDEILEQQSEFRRRGGKFIIPVPEVNIV